MRMKGKVSLWYWLLLIGLQIAFLYGIFYEKAFSLILIGGFVDFIVVPFAVRNYVLLTDDTLTIVFGFSKDSIRIDEIEQVVRTNDPISTTAASFDRIKIKGRRKELICAVKEKDMLFRFLREKNPEISFGKDKF